MNVWYLNRETGCYYYYYYYYYYDYNYYYFFLNINVQNPRFSLATNVVFFLVDFNVPCVYFCPLNIIICKYKLFRV